MRKRRPFLIIVGRNAVLYLSDFIALIFPESPKVLSGWKLLVISLLLLAGFVFLGMVLRP